MTAMPIATTVPAVKVTNGRTSVVHRVPWDYSAPLGALAPRTLCNRPTTGMLALNRQTPWERVAWEAASQGPCARCSAQSHALGTITPPAPANAAQSL